jgi:hypothetical protein
MWLLAFVFVAAGVSVTVYNYPNMFPRAQIAARLAVVRVRSLLRPRPETPVVRSAMQLPPH